MVNAAAGSVTRRKRLVIDKALRVDHGLEIAETSERGHASKLAREAALAGFDVVAVLAGDGTLNEAADGLRGSATALAPLPGGTTNVLARTIGVSRDVVDATAQLLASLEERRFRRIGLGVANERAFLFNAGIGFDAAVVDRVERRSRYKRVAPHPLYLGSTFSTWFRHYDHSTGRFTVAVAGAEPIEGATLAIVSNSSPYSFFGPRRIVVSPEAGLDVPLSVATFRIRHALPLLAVGLSALGSGRRLRHSRAVTRHREVREATISSERPFPWQVDGEYLGECERLALRYEPAALSLVVPPPDPTS